MPAKSAQIKRPPKELFTLHEGNSRDLDFLLRSYSSPAKPLLTATITSPPYGDLKDYGHHDQIGWGQPYDEYLVELRRIFRTIHSHTRDDGCLWLIADTFRPGGEDVSRLEMLPFQLANELSAVGWTLRDIIVWRKDKTLPWSGRGRLRNAFEYVLFFVKTSDFKYHIDRIRDPEELEEWWVKWPERYNPAGKVPDNVWDFPIPVQGSWSTTSIQHACPLPPDMIERILLLSTDKGDAVFDPFAGSGVVIAEAERLKRKGLGIELVKKHIDAYEKVVRPEILERRGSDIRQRKKGQASLKDSIVKLRALKYPRVLVRELLKKHPDLPRPAMAVSLVDEEPISPEYQYGVVSARTIFVFDNLNGEVTALQRALVELSKKRPASKFGVVGEIQVASRSDLSQLLEAQPLFLYTGGRTYMTEGPIELTDLAELTEKPNRANCPPIIGNVEIREQPRRRSAAVVVEA